MYGICTDLSSILYSIKKYLKKGSRARDFFKVLQEKQNTLGLASAFVYLFGIIYFWVCFCFMIIAINYQPKIFWVITSMIALLNEVVVPDLVLISRLFPD